MITAIIADDDIIQRTIIRKIIVNNYTRIDVIAEAETALELIEASNKHKPHLLLLDIKLGSTEIFDYLTKLETEPVIIFISTEKQFAINAFRFNALDFIPKPIDKLVFDSAMNKVLKKLDLEIYKNAAFTTLNYLVINSANTYEIIYLDEVISMTAQGRCTLFTTKDKKSIISSKNLSQYEYLLYKYPLFIKVSRSCLINFKFVKRVTKDAALYCELTNGDVIPVSRRKTNDFKIFLNNLQ